MKVGWRIKYIKEVEAHIATATEKLNAGEEKASKLEEQLKALEAKKARYRALLKKLKAKESRLRERLDAVDTKNIERTLAIANAEDYVERSKHDLFFETLEWVISNPDFVDPDPDNKKLSQPKLDAAAKFLRECSDEPMLHEIADRWASTFLSDLNEICRRMARL